MLLQELDWITVEEPAVWHTRTINEILWPPLSSNGWDPCKAQRKQNKLIQQDFLCRCINPSDLTCQSRFYCRPNPSNMSCINFTFLPTSLNTFFLLRHSTAEERKKKQVLLNRQVEQDLYCTEAMNSSLIHAVVDRLRSQKHRHAAMQHQRISCILYNMFTTIWKQQQLDLNGLYTESAGKRVWIMAKIIDYLLKTNIHWMC